MATLALAWPNLRASYRYLPVDFAIQRYYETREIPSDRLPVLIRFAEEAIAHHDHYRYHDGLSLLLLLRGVDLNTPALERRPAYERAAEEAETALARSPVQPLLWYRLATIRSTLREEPEDILSAWKMAIFTGRSDVTLLAPRVGLGLGLRGYMDEESVAMLRDQIHLAWRVRPGALVQMLSERDPGLAIVRPLVAPTDPTAFADMEAWLEKLR